MYVAAFVPDEGESITDLQTRFPSLAMGDFLQPRPLPDGSVELSVDPDRFHDIFCADVPDDVAAFMAHAQRPLAATVFEEPAAAAAWRAKPSWAVFGTGDHPIAAGAAPLLVRPGRLDGDRDRGRVALRDGLESGDRRRRHSRRRHVDLRRTWSHDAADLARVPRPPQRRGRLPGGCRRASTSRTTSRCSRPGRRPHTPLDAWSFEIRGEVDEPRSWTWEQFTALPSERITVDIHCVTKWSKLDTSWRGVSLDTLLDGVDTSAEYVLAFCDGGYTTNLPLEDVRDGKAWVAYEYDGEPLDPEHGGPARLLVPHLYFWKSAKWVRGHRAAPGRRRPGSGRATATTTTATRGKNSGTPATDLAARARASSSSTETPRTKSIVLDARRLAGPPAPASTSTSGSRPRTATRRSAATRSRPRRRTTQLVLTVERLDDGEVSPYLTDVARARRRARAARPDRRLLRLAGRRSAARCCSSPAAPASCRCGRCSATTARPRSEIPVRLLYSARTLGDLIYREELELVDDDTPSAVTLTREWPADWQGHSGRVDRDLLAEVAWPPDQTAAHLRVRADRLRRGGRRGAREAGHAPGRIRTERFGPTGT